jgi:phage tail-like protein
MAEQPSAQRRTYPLPAYNFRVTIGDAVIGCSEVSGLSVGGETVTYRHGLSAWEGEEIIRLTLPKYIPITLKKGIMIGGTSLLDWLNAPAEPRRMEISLCDTTGTPAVRWQIAKAVPVKLDGPSLSAGSNEVAIETLEIMAAGIQLQHVG